jgi:hypothetical protein
LLRTVVCPGEAFRHRRHGAAERSRALDIQSSATPCSHGDYGSSRFPSDGNLRGSRPLSVPSKCEE